MRIILGICLVVMICVSSVSAVVQFPTPQNSLTQSPSDELSATINPYSARGYIRMNTGENIRIPRGLSEIQPPSSSGIIQKPDFSAMPDNPGGSETIRSIFEKYQTSGISTQSITYISKEEAFDIALARFSGIELLEPMTATLKRSTKPCWEVYITGYDPGKWTKEIHMYEGGIVFIDAVTGEILDVYILM